MKWAIREAVDVYFKAKSVFKLGARTIRAGEPVLIFDTVKTSTLEVASEVSYVTGGRGNTRLLSYEGDKTLTFQFEDALLSNEGLAILSGADLIPARNKNLYGAHADARSVIAHYTEKYSVVTGNYIDNDKTNTYADDTSLYPTNGRDTVNPASAAGVDVYSTEDGQGVATYKRYKDYSPRGGELNVWLTRKPYVGQNASIYVMLLDTNGEMSGAPIEINLSAGSDDNRRSYLSKFKSGDYFVAFNAQGKPIGNPDILIAATDNGVPQDNGYYDATAFGGAFAGLNVVKYKIAAGTSEDKGYSGRYYGYFSDEESWGDPKARNAAPHVVKRDSAAFDDQVAHYVDLRSAAQGWSTGWGPIEFYIRKITATTYDAGFDSANAKASDNVCDAIAKKGTADVSDFNGYAYLLAPSGSVAQPKAYKEGTQFVYKVNVPSIMYQDIVLVDYYVEYQHDATQVSILPDKFGPYMYVEGSSLVRRASDGMDLPVEFVIPKFKITTALTFTLQSTGDASTFTFQGDAYADYSKFDLTRKVLADIQILDADDNYDGAEGDTASDPTSYRRYRYNEDTDGEYLWKDPSIEAHANIDYSDAGYVPENGGPATRTTDGTTGGLIDTAKDAAENRYKVPLQEDQEKGPTATGDTVGGQGDYVRPTA